MIEEWLVELGAEVIDSIYGPVGDGSWGTAYYGPLRGSAHGWRGPGEVRSLILRYIYAAVGEPMVLQIGWYPVFDRWSTCTDWEADVPETKDELLWILDEAVRQGEAGIADRHHDTVELRRAERV